MPRYTVKYEVVLESSILIDAQDEETAADSVERMVRGGQNLAKPIDVGIITVEQVEEDPQGDW